MAYIGKKPTDKPLTGSDLGNDIVDSQHYAAGSIDNEHIADDAIDSEHYADTSIDEGHIANDAVTYAKIQNVSADERILGRVSGADGVIEELTKSNVLTMLNVADGSEANVADTAITTADTSWSGSQRGTPNTVTDGTLDLDTANNFQYTPAGADVFEFTNEAAGQSGFVKLINPSAHAISVGSEVKKGSSWDVSTAGTYLVSYYTDGTNVYVSASEALS
jgi:hypothetical protein